MGRADGILVGGSLLAGVVFGAPAVVAVPALYLLNALLLDRLVIGRVVLCGVLAAVGALRAPSEHADAAWDPSQSTSEMVVGQVRGIPRAARGGERFLFEVRRVRTGDHWHGADFTALVTWPSEGVNAGDVLWLAWAVDDPAQLPPGYRDYVRTQGADTTAYAFAGEVVERGRSWRRPFVAVRRALGETLLSAAPRDRGALLAGLVTGDDSDLSRGAVDAFRRTATTHITAVSGSNLALVASLWGLLGATAGWRRRWWLLAGIVISVWGYALVVGLEPPALRAAIVATLVALSIRLGRRPDPLTLVLLAAAAMALIEPAVSRTLSFQLSVAASAALVSCFPRGANAGVRAWARGAAIGVVAAHFATLPLVIATFGVWAPVGTLANLAILPLVPPTFALAFLAGLVGFAWPVLGAFLGMVAGFGAGAIIEVVDNVARLAPSIAVGWDTGPASLLVWLVSLVVVGMLSTDARRWGAEVAARRCHGGDAALQAAACAGGALLLTLVLWWW